MGKITVNDGPSSNRPYWEDPEPEPEVVPEPAPRTVKIVPLAPKAPKPKAGA